MHNHNTLSTRREQLHQALRRNLRRDCLLNFRRLQTVRLIQSRVRLCKAGQFVPLGTQQELQCLRDIPLVQNASLSLVGDDFRMLGPLESCEVDKVSCLELRSTSRMAVFNVDLSRFRSLENLTVCQTSISDIEGLSFNAPMLEWLDLSSNQIQITKFGPLPSSLKHLNLSHNRISSLNFLSNLDIQNLQELFLSSNLINDIHPLTHLDFKKLQKISLDSNNIRCADSLSHIDLRNLTHINLNHNPIQSLQWLSGLEIGDNVMINISSITTNDYTPFLRMPQPSSVAVISMERSCRYYSNDVPIVEESATSRQLRNQELSVLFEGTPLLLVSDQSQCQLAHSRSQIVFV